MPQTPIWKQSLAERVATFDAVFAEVQPTDQQTPSAKAQLRVLQRLIVKKRAEGYTLEQICERLKDPRIGVDVTTTYIRAAMRDASRLREKRRKLRVAATMAASQKLANATPAAHAASKILAPVAGNSMAKL